MALPILCSSRSSIQSSKYRSVNITLALESYLSTYIHAQEVYNISTIVRTPSQQEMNWKCAWEGIECIERGTFYFEGKRKAFPMHYNTFYLLSPLRICYNSVAYIYLRAVTEFIFPSWGYKYCIRRRISLFVSQIAETYFSAPSFLQPCIKIVRVWTEWILLKQIQIYVTLFILEDIVC